MLWISLLVLQAPPATDIYVAELRVTDRRVSVSSPVNGTARPGYDNQPFFLRDGRSFLYTSVHEDTQADILCIHDVRLHVLAPGHRFDLGARRPIRP